MDEKEKLRLQEEYAYLSDEELTDLFNTNKEEFEEGVYGIVLAEFEKRGLHEKIKELERIKRKQQESLKKEWVVIYKIFDLVEATVIEDILNKNNLPTDTQHFDVTPVHLLYSASNEKGVIRIEKEYEEKANQIINDFEKDKSKYNA